MDDEPTPIDPAAVTLVPPSPARVSVPVVGGPDGRYALGSEIARGGMGEVYYATDLQFGREVAVKVLRLRLASNADAVRRFADEARVTATLAHPGIPPVHDLGTLPDGRPFLAMKLIRGRRSTPCSPSAVAPPTTAGG